MIFFVDFLIISRPVFIIIESLEAEWFADTIVKRIT